jgi:hypothetical protein
VAHSNFWLRDFLTFQKKTFLYIYVFGDVSEYNEKLDFWYNMVSEKFP